MSKNKIMYCAIPTRFTQTPQWPQIKERIKEMVRNWGYAPVIPFDIGSYEDFEKGIVGREESIEYMLYVNAYPKSDTGVIGISDGTMGEFRDALDSKKEIRVDLSLDSEWGKILRGIETEIWGFICEASRAELSNRVGWTKSYRENFLVGAIT